MSVAVDSSLVLALYDGGDAHHAEAVAWIHDVDDELVTTPLVLAEIDERIGASRPTPARRCSTTSSAARSACAGGPTRSPSRSRIARERTRARPRRRLARGARRAPSHAGDRDLRPRPFPPAHDADGQRFVLLPADPVRGPNEPMNRPPRSTEPRMSTNSFDAKATLDRRRARARDLPPRRAAGEVRRRAAAVLAQDPAREPAPHRGQRRRRGGGHRGAGDVGPEGRAEQGDRVHARARRDAGLHRRARRRRPRGDARRDGRPRRRPGEDQAARAGRAGHRPLGPGRRVRHARLRSRNNTELEFERNQERYRSCAGARTRSTNFKVVPPGTGIVHQVNLEYLARVVFVDDADRPRPIPTRSSAPTRTRR